MEDKINLSSGKSLKFSIQENGKEKGTFRGVAYSGKSIAYHGGFQNLIIDIDTMSFKKQIPVFRDHRHESVIGKAELFVEDNQLKVEGKIYSSSELGQEVQNYAMEGALWELSVGLGFAEIESVKENETVEVNGMSLAGPAHILKDSSVIEVSVVAVGADSQAFAEVFSKKLNDKNKETKEMSEKKEEKKNVVEFDAEAWEKFACACGGKKESKLSEIEENLEAEKEEKKKLSDEVEELKKELKKYKDKEKKEKLSAKLEEKKVELSEEKFNSLIEDDSKLEAYFSFLEDITVSEKEEKTETEKKKIDPKFAKKEDFSKEQTPKQTDQERKEKIELAHNMVKDGKAKTIHEALNKLGAQSK